MITIAIVDDEKQDRKELLNFFKMFQEETNETLDIYEYSSGTELLNNIGHTFDLLCLDIDMPVMDGIETAKKIRMTDSTVTIIFITNMAQMAIKGYEVQALDFIVKPVNYYSFSMKIRNALTIIANRKSTDILITTKNSVEKFSTDALYYIEVSGHYIYYHTKTGVFRQKATLTDIEGHLKKYAFERCNNCYLVNLKCVECINKDDVKVGGDWLKISRPRKKKFLQSLANYMGGVKL